MANHTPSYQVQNPKKAVKKRLDQNIQKLNINTMVLNKQMLSGIVDSGSQILNPGSRSEDQGYWMQDPGY